KQLLSRWCRALVWRHRGPWDDWHGPCLGRKRKACEPTAGAAGVTGRSAVGAPLRLMLRPCSLPKTLLRESWLGAHPEPQRPVVVSSYSSLDVKLLRVKPMALGNHEFDNGVEGLINPLLKEAKFPILSANIKAKGPLASKISGLYLPYKILSVGEEVVGIVGYTSKETPFLSNPGPNLVFEDEIAALQPEVDKLKTLNVNKIIALGHSGFEVDKLIAQKVKGVDVVVGGHTNTFLYTGEAKPWILAPQCSAAHQGLSEPGDVY
ncbi:NT5E, partial [Cervus elaphus hippelaphus]